MAIMNTLGFTKGGKRRNAGMFKPGVSGNPAGRPKENIQVTQLARSGSPEAIMRLYEIALSSKTKDSVALRAINAIMDRAMGKSK